MSYRTEFPDFDPSTLPVMPEGFDDVSHHNCACPCFVSDAAGFEIWVDYAEPAKREHKGYPRFMVSPQASGVETSGPSIATDEWTEVLAFIASNRRDR